MIDKIDITSETHEIDHCASSIDAYVMLKRKYRDDQLFLLESAGGPKQDCTKSVIAFDPAFTLSVEDKRIKLSGNQCIIDIILSNSILEKYNPKSNSLYLTKKTDLFECLRDIESVFRLEHDGESTELTAGLWGYFGYDSIFYMEDLEQKIVRDNGYSSILLSFYCGVIEIDLHNDKTLLTINRSKYLPKINSDEIERLISEKIGFDAKEDFSFDYKTKLNVDESLYSNWYTKAKSHISKGDIYQIQLGHELEISSEIPPFDVYLRLRKLNPSPYMYYFKTIEGVHVIGASPEMFVNLGENNDIVMRPIAGTIRNSKDPQVNKQQKEKLLSDEKERAEHLMLVDLCRNDIAHCSQPDSLLVDELMTTEEYSHVIHIVSNVVGKIASGLDKYDVMTSTFPAGTMTGTPKIRAMEIIEDTEISSRGIYAGCVGYFGFNNSMVTALCIRTAVYYNSLYKIRASGGIVEDSSSSGEWNETINKLSSTYFAITGKELKNEDFIN